MGYAELIRNTERRLDLQEKKIDALSGELFAMEKLASVAGLSFAELLAEELVINFPDKIKGLKAALAAEKKEYNHLVMVWENASSFQAQK